MDWARRTGRRARAGRRWARGWCAGKGAGVRRSGRWGAGPGAGALGVRACWASAAGGRDRRGAQGRAERSERARQAAGSRHRGAGRADEQARAAGVGARSAGRGQSQHKQPTDFSGGSRTAQMSKNIFHNSIPCFGTDQQPIPGIYSHQAHDLKRKFQN